MTDPDRPQPSRAFAWALFVLMGLAMVMATAWRAGVELWRAFLLVGIMGALIVAVPIASRIADWLNEEDR